MTKNVTLERKTSQFRDEKTGQVQDFVYYVINIAGIDVKVKPADSTGKQLIETLFTK